MFFVRPIDQRARARDQIMPMRGVCGNLAAQDDFARVLQSRQRICNFVRTEVRFHQQRVGLSESVARKLRLDAKIDIVRRGSARSYKCRLVSASKILVINIDIQNYATGNRVLFGSVANDKAVSDKSEDL